MARTAQMLRDDMSGIIVPSYCNSRTWGTPNNWTTEITVKGVLPAIAGGAALGVGLLCLTLPAGERIITNSSMSMAIKQTTGNITAGTPVVGLGTVIATGAVSVLSGTATFQNIQAGTAAADCNGTPTVQTLNTTLAIATAAAHGIFFNAAMTWAASGDPAALVAGTFTLNWR